MFTISELLPRPIITDIACSHSLYYQLDSLIQISHVHYLCNISQTYNTDITCTLSTYYQPDLIIQISHVHYLRNVSQTS